MMCFNLREFLALYYVSIKCLNIVILFFVKEVIQQTSPISIPLCDLRHHNVGRLILIIYRPGHVAPPMANPGNSIVDHH